MKNLFTLVSFLPLLISCIRGGEALAKLDDVFSYIESRPDSALTVLEGMNKEDLTSKRSKAKHALLYSMALDKNYIDLQSDSVIAPAVAYYQNHGSADERLLTFYYRGRIAMNAGKYEDAISYFVRAERYADAADNDIAIARLYKAKTLIYQYSYDSNMMIESAKETARYYMRGRDTMRYVNALNEVIAGYLQSQDTLNARVYLDTIASYGDCLTQRQISDLYSAKLFLNEYSRDCDSAFLISEYMANVADSSSIRWLSVANAYYYGGYLNQALHILDIAGDYENTDGAFYSLLAGNIYYDLGNHELASISYKKYIESTGKKNGYLFDADVNFIEERYSILIRVLHKNYLITILILSVLILCLIIVVLIFRNALIKQHALYKEQQLKIIEHKKLLYATMYDEALSEIYELKQSLKLSKLSPELRSHISERLAVLNKFITAHISDNYTQTAKEELSKLMQNRDQFIESTRLTFYFTYPKFLAYLKKLNLTNKEIGYCCLYAIGLKGKEISHYIGNHGQYKFNGDIRSKLGLSPHDTNLDIYLRKLLEKLS